MRIVENLINAHLDHRRAYVDFRYVYPVISRRARGVSIGINLNPDKKCNFNCIYCEVDRNNPVRRKGIDLDLLAQELRDMLRIYQDGTLFTHEPFSQAPTSWRKLNDIAFSGNGEPTTCPVFEQAVEVAWQVREENELETIKLILITNASCLDRPGVIRGLDRMQERPHEIWVKLDTGTSDYYKVINRSHVPYAWILRNITRTACWCPLIIQSLFQRVSDEPPSPSEIFAYADRLNEIRRQGGKILGLQLYTIARSTATHWSTALSDEELNGIALMVKARTGLPQQIFYGHVS